MNETPHTETISCLYCGSDRYATWAVENGFTAVKCSDCGLVYVNPRPVQSLISSAVETGIHTDADGGKTAIARRQAHRIRHYKGVLGRLFAEVWRKGEPLSWLDVGAGYGEVLEAVAALAPPGSTVEGIEPMLPKASKSQGRGLPIQNKYVKDVDRQYKIVSLINVFSHLPDFREFLRELKRVIEPGGELLVETGNAADLPNSSFAPTELDLPDHLVFAGESHLVGYLEGAGFEIVAIKRLRKDGLVNTAKNLIKKLIGRPVFLRLPYTSPHRSILVRARRPA